MLYFEAFDALPDFAAVHCIVRGARTAKRGVPGRVGAIEHAVSLLRGAMSDRGRAMTVSGLSAVPRIQAELSGEPRLTIPI